MKISRILFASFFVFHISLGAEEIPPDNIGMILAYLPYGKVRRLCKAHPEDKNGNVTGILQAVRRARQCYKDMYALPPLQHSVSNKIETDTLKFFSFFIDSPKNPSERYQKVQTAWEFIRSFNTDQTIQINILDRYQKTPDPKEAFLNDINKRSTSKKGARFAKNTGDKKYCLVLRTKTKTLDDQSTKRQIDLDLDHMPPEYSLFQMYERLKDFPDVPAAIKTDNTDFLSALLRWDLKTIQVFNQSSYQAPTESYVFALLQLMKPVVEFDFSAVNTMCTLGSTMNIPDSFLEKMAEILKVKHPDVQAIKFKDALYGPQNAEEILEIITPPTMEEPIQFKWTSTKPLQNDLQHFPKTIAYLPPYAYRKFMCQYPDHYCYERQRCAQRSYTPEQWIEKWKNWDFWTTTHNRIANAYGITNHQVGKKRNQDNVESDSEEPLRKVQKTSR